MIRPSTSTGPATGWQGQVAINEFWENTNCVFKARLIANILSSSFTIYCLLRNDGEMPTTFERFPKCVSKKMVSKAKKKKVQKSEKKTNKRRYLRRAATQNDIMKSSIIGNSPCDDQDTCQVVATYDLPGITGAHGHRKVSELRIPRSNCWQSWGRRRRYL